MRSKGIIKTRKELKFSRLPTLQMYALLPDSKEQVEAEVKALTNAILSVVDISTCQHDGVSDYLVYAKCQNGHEFIWDIDGRDVEVFVPALERDRLEELLSFAHELNRMLSKEAK